MKQITKKTKDIKIEHRVYSKDINKWAIRGVDKKTKERGILLCIGDEEKHHSVGTWYEIDH